MQRSHAHRFGLAAGLALGAVVAAGAGPAAAQDDGAIVAGPSAHVAAGSCEAPAVDALHELSPFETGFLKRRNSTGERVGSATADAMLSSSTELEVAYDDLYEQPHAIVVLDAEQRPVACGEIGGYLADDALIVGLRPLEGAGLAGFATLWDDQDVAAVELHLAEALLVPDGTNDDDDRGEVAGDDDTDDADDGNTEDTDTGDTVDTDGDDTGENDDGADG